METTENAKEMSSEDRMAELKDLEYEGYEKYFEHAGMGSVEAVELLPEWHQKRYAKLMKAEFGDCPFCDGGVDEDCSFCKEA